LGLTKPPKGGHNGRKEEPLDITGTRVLLAVSRQFCADYNLGDIDPIGKSHYEIFPEIPERWKAIHRRCLAGNTDSREIDPFPRADGTVDYVRWEINPWYYPDGKIGGIILSSMVVNKLSERYRGMDFLPSSPE